MVVSAVFVEVLCVFLFFSSCNSLKMSFHVQNGIHVQPNQDPGVGVSHKIFVGQVPRTWEEKDLRPMFEEYGEIYDLSILRDKFTGQHKGCAFLTFSNKESAIKAQTSLHESKILPGMQNPVQVKPADSETKSEERKLFIGMISRHTTEEDLKIMFSPFGTIEEVTVLKNSNGASKGCAFLKFATRLQAQNAVIKMHNSTTMEGCSSPVVVKAADTEKDKAQKRMQTVASNMFGLGLSMQLAQGNNLGIATNTYQQSLSQPNNGDIQLLQQAIAAGTLPAGLASGLINPASLSMPALGIPGTMGAIVAAAALANQQQQQQQQQQQITAPSQAQLGLAVQASLNQQSLTNSVLTSTSTNSLNNLSSLGNLAAAQSQASGIQLPGIQSSALQASGLQSNALQGNGLQATGLQAAGLQSSALQGAGLASMAANLASLNNSSSADALSQAAYSGIQQYAATFPNAYMNLFQQQSQRTPQKEGPDGSNLFIYHLPPEFTDADLFQTFLPFGSVISAKVFIDKNTNLSKCFGFVSYDNVMSAQNAIQAMHGFQIGNKRLKVQLKRPKDANRPY